MATDNPKGFFTQLKVKLDRVAEDRRRKEILEDSQLDNVDDILDNHIERVMKTPNPLESPSRNSPPPIRNGSYPHSMQTRATNFQIPQTRDTVQKKNIHGHNVIIPQHGLKPQQQVDLMRRMEMPRKWREIPIGMTPNEVPDVPDMPVCSYVIKFFFGKLSGYSIYCFAGHSSACAAQHTMCEPECMHKCYTEVVVKPDDCPRTLIHI